MEDDRLTGDFLLRLIGKVHMNVGAGVERNEIQTYN